MVVAPFFIKPIYNMFEKVSPSHPDKLADRIAGAIVDLAYTKAKNPRIATEVLLGHGKATVMIESSEDFRPVEIDPIVRRLAGDVELDLHAVKQDTHLANNQEGAVGTRSTASTSSRAAVVWLRPCSMSPSASRTSRRTRSPTFASILLTTIG